MTEQELEKINDMFKREMQSIYDADPGQGSPYYFEGFEGDEEEDDEQEKQANWECWQDDMEEVSHLSLRLLRGHLVAGGLYTVSYEGGAEPLPGMSLLTFLEEIPQPEEWQNCSVSPWNAAFVFLTADGRKLYVSWSEIWDSDLLDEEVFSLFDTDDLVFRGFPLFTRIG